MLTPAISKVRDFAGSWKNLLALGTLPLLGVWIYSRVWMVNPAILGDEYLYSMNARKVGPWDPPVAGDFSNYLFNFLYQGTNLCGENFYSCTKALNIAFFLGFVFTLFLIGVKLVPFWVSYVFMILASLSPLSVYTSMFLPESMYFFFIGLVLLATIKALAEFTWQKWATVGVAIGVASLVKPHAWLSALAIGITLITVGLFKKGVGLRGTTTSSAALALGAVAARIVVGVSVAGPKALGFFGQYFGLSTIETVISGPISDDQNSMPVGQNPMAGVASLFLPQLTVHVLTLTSLMALAMLGVALAVYRAFIRKGLDESLTFAFLSFIWLVVMIIEIVAFTGWITGSGDDHSTRVLLRYYEFHLLVTPLAALGIFFSKRAPADPPIVRWILTISFILLLTPAFSGFFNTLTVQIADAPSLAGLIVDRSVFDAAALLGFASLLVYAGFPKLAPWALVALLPVTFVATGWQIQDQYQSFRGEPSPADLAGQIVANEFTEQEQRGTWVIGTSRFEATNAAFWIDRSEVTYDLFAPGSEINTSLAPSDTKVVVVVGDLRVIGAVTRFTQGEGFTIFRID